MRTTRPAPPSDPTRAFQPMADPGSLWLAGQYDDALRMLRSAVLGRQGLLVLIGETGTGKTMLAHALGTRLRDEGVMVGRLLYPILEGMDVRAAIAEAFGLPATVGDRDGFVQQFQRFVTESVAAGRRVALILDEAHRLNREVLVELGRLPYGDAGSDVASLSLLLIGQRGLLAALRAEALEPDVLCHLGPLTREQTAQYVAHRLAAVRHRGRLFTPSALRKIWVVSEGVPHAINELCVEALHRLRRAGRRTVTAAMIERPSGEEPGDVPTPARTFSPVAVAPSGRPAPPRSAKRRLVPLVAAACVGLALGGLWAVARSDRARGLLPVPVATTAATAQDVAPSAMPEATAAPDASSRLTAPPARPDPAGASVSIPFQPHVAATAGHARGADGADATRVIDWLLRSRGADGGPRD